MRRQHSLLRRSELRVELRQFQLCPRYQKPLGLQLRDKCVAGRLEPRPRVAPLAGQQHGRGQRVQDQQHQAGPADFASADSLPSNGCGTMQFQRRNCLQVRHTFERMCHTRVNVSVHQKRPSVHKKGHLFTTLFTRCGRSHFLSHHATARPLACLELSHSSTPQPLRHPQPCVPCGRRPSTQLKASPVEKDVAGVPTMTAAEEKLDQVSRSVDQVVEVFHFMEGEDSPRRVLCPRGALFLAGRCSSDGRLLCEA